MKIYKNPTITANRHRMSSRITSPIINTAHKEMKILNHANILRLERDLNLVN